MTAYTEDDAKEAPHGHVRLPGTDVDVVAYASGENLTVLVNKGGVCVYRATLRNALRKDLAPYTDPHPALDDAFVVRDVGAALAAIASRQR